MKKIVLALMLAFVGSYAHAVATDTPTLTLTLTPTPTFTPTRTNTPVSGFGDQKGHVIINAKQFLQGDGITAPSLTGSAGNPTVYIAVSQSQTCAVLSTGTSSARFVLVVPADYMCNGRLWLHGTLSTATNTATVEADVALIDFGALTSTSTVLVGPATNVQTQFNGPLQSARFSRFSVPLSGTAGACGTAKTAASFIPGNTCNFLLTRTGGSGDMYITGAEFEYSVNYPLRP